jgi:hypothetical protein
MNLSYFLNHQTIKKKIKDVWNIALVVLDLLCGFDIRESEERQYLDGEDTGLIICSIDCTV